MQRLNNEEMIKITGGGLKYGWALIGGALAFLMGVFKGIINPSACK